MESWEREREKRERGDPIYYQLRWLETRSEINVNRRKWDIFLDRLENEYLTWESISFIFFRYSKSFAVWKVERKTKKLNVKRGITQGAIEGSYALGL